MKRLVAPSQMSPVGYTTITPPVSLAQVPRLRGRARGIGLAELMVAIAVGALVLLLGATLLANANAAYVAQLDGAEIDDAGRYALEAVGRAVRQAAYIDWDQGDTAVGVDAAMAAPLSGLDARSLSKNTSGIDDALPDVANGSDVLALRFAGAGPAPDGDGSMLSCAGFGVAGAQDGWSIFYVARGADGQAALYCKYRGAAGWGADALVGGVDSFQVLYGVDTDTPADGVANRYLNASALDALDDALLLEGADAAERARDRRRKTHWKRVVSVKVALALHGARRTRANVEPKVFDLFGPEYSAGAGGADTGTRLDEARMGESLRTRERKVVGITIALRNGARGGSL
jgi:type IV pilus assembly protein PilW